MENRKQIILLIFIIIIALIILIFKVSNKTEISKNNTIAQKNIIKNEERTETIINEPKTVYIKEHYMKNETIYGIVKNNTNNVVKNLELSADCYDKNNNKLLNTKNYLDELKPGETWRFAMWTNSNATKYKNLKITYK